MTRHSACQRKPLFYCFHHIAKVVRIRQKILGRPLCGTSHSRRQSWCGVLVTLCDTLAVLSSPHCTIACVHRIQGNFAYKKTPTALGPPQDPGHRPRVGSYEGAWLDDTARPHPTEMPGSPPSFRVDGELFAVYGEGQHTDKRGCVSRSRLLFSPPGPN